MMMCSAGGAEYLRPDCRSRIDQLDFADIRTIMSEKGPALMGVGEGSGENRTAEAAGRYQQALLETPLTGLPVC